ncbi:S-methyl-5-thioribose-1-phosphate isomerase [candidate division LCP-89 bacterium B3_LCP]|uniref:Methylthioribose-1-phosphate isomerase n=1 Tax=candidate division LCP-89 bacterium B3_LCP TaxID=2012998 RepID=A0A532UY09_UNCL8|nr:MAG: S-methyl-5-thioribose-1-phosphate isomerase [candidate division LCP-89 bacterium B3_LCP]
MRLKTLEWLPDEKKVRLIEQTKLPGSIEYIETDDYLVMCDAIRRLAVRGAPALGCAGAYGVLIGALSLAEDGFDSFSKETRRIMDELRATRPTAVNLPWAIDRMESVLDQQNDTRAALDALTKEALAIHEEDDAMCRSIGENGATLLADEMSVLTHCNAGSLATGGMGTALAPVYVAHEQGKKIHVYADETRPLLQGARLTSWELQQNGIDVTLICDNMAAVVMRKGWVNAVIVGSDRIACNGDVANKIGTYTVALAAKEHNVPFYVAAPTSTVDPSLASGDLIPIEERASEEVAGFDGCRTAPDGIKTYNPAFDVTPNELVAAIITERGVHKPPYDFSFLRG